MFCESLNLYRVLDWQSIIYRGNEKPVLHKNSFALIFVPRHSSGILLYIFCLPKISKSRNTNVCSKIPLSKKPLHIENSRPICIANRMIVWTDRIVFCILYMHCGLSERFFYWSLVSYRNQSTDFQRKWAGCFLYTAVSYSKVFSSKFQYFCCLFLYFRQTKYVKQILCRMNALARNSEQHTYDELAVTFQFFLYSPIFFASTR